VKIDRWFTVWVLLIIANNLENITYELSEFWTIYNYMDEVFLKKFDMKGGTYRINAE